MSYQQCRWYDPYPKLAFALKLLYLSPQGLQRQALQDLRSFLTHEWGERQMHHLLSRHKPVSLKHRWYDEDPQTAGTLDLIKESTSSFKNRVADQLLKLLLSVSQDYKPRG
jgi:hypothetical protein